MMEPDKAPYKKAALQLKKEIRNVVKDESINKINNLYKTLNTNLPDHTLDQLFNKKTITFNLHKTTKCNEPTLKSTIKFFTPTITPSSLPLTLVPSSTLFPNRANNSNNGHTTPIHFIHLNRCKH